ncbi:arginine N-succinyltransferase [Hyphomonas oceanitis]|uniref:Arginine N-succinyltransferase n=1 Tax=Hyphomonas oceanitis SCH89 TaxID=1280953 RepID=A0A059G4E4_9PROT|nr:arginine N-succinyltransferase [Hyphomonas oceanitis]KDA01420.1 Arginine N-succinyltransferase [Hyphomonas oceanitis SCH89]
MVPSGYIIRPVNAGDLAGLFALCLQAGPGFTSLQADETYLRALITCSEASFGAPDSGAKGTHFLVMEYCQTGDVVGCASVKTGVGSDAFMCADFEMSGPSHRPNALTLRRTLQGFTEVGSLFLHPAHRASGAGRYLARARYMLMATRPDLFDQPIVSQLRGWCDEAECSPFYDAIWSPRLGQTYAQTDARLARDGAGFVLSEFEGLNVPLDTLEEAARHAIGRPHDTAAGALCLLAQEGFRASSLIDMSDGGPIVLSTLGELNSAHTARQVVLMDGRPEPSAQMMLLASSSLQDFRAYVGCVSIDAQDLVICHASALNQLRASEETHFLISAPPPATPGKEPHAHTNWSLDNV